MGLSADRDLSLLAYSDVLPKAIRALRIKRNVSLLPLTNCFEQCGALVCSVNVEPHVSVERANQ
jgi:hypothetical protein